MTSVDEEPNLLALPRPEEFHFISPRYPIVAQICLIVHRSGIYVGNGSVGLATEMTDIERGRWIVETMLRRYQWLSSPACRPSQHCVGPRMARPCTSASHQRSSLLCLLCWSWLLPSFFIERSTTMKRGLNLKWYSSFFTAHTSSLHLKVRHAMAHGAFSSHSETSTR